MRIRKFPQPPKAAEKIWAFFLCTIKMSVGKLQKKKKPLSEVQFWAFANLMGVRFGAFSILTNVSFRENEILAYVRLELFFKAMLRAGKTRMP